jgi:hypothetical protein
MRFYDIELRNFREDSMFLDTEVKVPFLIKTTT